MGITAYLYRYLPGLSYVSARSHPSFSFVSSPPQNLITIPSSTPTKVYSFGHFALLNQLVEVSDGNIQDFCTFFCTH